MTKMILAALAVLSITLGGIGIAAPAHAGPADHYVGTDGSAA